MADRLELADRAAEGVAVICVLDRGFEQTLGRRIRTGGGDQPFGLELPADVVEALADLAENRIGRNPEVLEGELAGIRGVHAHLLEVLSDRETGQVVAFLVADVDQHQGDAVVSGVGVGLGDQNHEVGPGRVGDEGLGTVDHVLVAVKDGGGADTGDVGTGTWFGDAERADLLAGDAGGEVLLLLLFGAEQVDGREDHVGLDGEAHAEAA